MHINLGHSHEGEWNIGAEGAPALAAGNLPDLRHINLGPSHEGVEFIVPEGSVEAMGEAAAAA